MLKQKQNELKAYQLQLSEFRIKASEVSYFNFENEYLFQLYLFLAKI